MRSRRRKQSSGHRPSNGVPLRFPYVDYSLGLKTNNRSFNYLPDVLQPKIVKSSQIYHAYQPSASTKGRDNDYNRILLHSDCLHVTTIRDNPRMKDVSPTTPSSALTSPASATWRTPTKGSILHVRQTLISSEVVLRENALRAREC